MKKINVTFEMAKGFANEITSKREKLASKKGFHLANVMVNAKFGKTEWDGAYEHINVSWEFFYPFSSVVAKKRRSKIYFNENACCTIPAKVLLYEIVKGVEEIEHVVELYKNGEFCIVENTYPTFIETVEKYGVEWFEKRIAEFFAYVANLEKVEVESNVENAEIINDPMLDEQENEDIDYLVTIFNEKMVEDITKDFESTLHTIVEYGDNSGDLEHVCGGFNYERDYENEWVEFYNENGNGGVNHAYEIFRNAPDFTSVDFFNEDNACELVYELGDTYGVGVDDNSWGECLIYVKNPNYMSDEMRANRIAKIVNDNWAKNAVEESVKLDWSLFDEQDMELMFENNDFAKMVYDRVCDSNEYFSECLAYDDCFYVWLTENVSCILVDYLYDLDSRPSWVNRKDFDFKDCGDYLDIVMFGRYHIGLYYDPSDSNADFACADNGGAYGKADMEYAVEIMDNRDMILALAEKARIVKPSVNEIVENALESVMDSDDEFYDDIICQIGDWFVKYTSPCDKFPSGCVLVVDNKGVNMGGTWCSVADFDTAVEYLVNTIEMCNKEFNKVA